MKNNKLTIGILTLYPNWNYGNILQGFALQQHIKMLGFKTVFINRQRNRANIFRIIASIIKRLILRFVMLKKVPVFILKYENEELNKICTNTLKFVNDYIFPQTSPIYSTLNLKSTLRKYNIKCIIVGSDQVWRPKYTYSIEDYFLCFLDKNSKVGRVAYAASFGTDDWEYSEEMSRKYSGYIKKFGAVSVREKSAVRLCRKHFNVDAVHVLDPTMLLDRIEYIKIANKAVFNVGKCEILTYLLNDNEIQRKIITIISDELKMNVFRINTKTENRKAPIEERIAPPVEYWLRGFSEAKYIITDSFHGTVFSIIFNKPFFVFGNKRRGLARFESLLDLFELKSRYITNIEELTVDKIRESIDWVKVNGILTEKRKLSKSFLLSALSEYIKL